MTYSPQVSYLVASDLDGTLLDHFTYSWEAATPSIERLQALDIPIVLNTSKTFFEVADLQSSLKINDPMIVENGSAIYVPKHHANADQFSPFNAAHRRCVLGVLREDVVAKLQTLRNKYGWQFEGYSDWDIADIIHHTGLNEASARQSMQRQFSEPIMWRDSDAAYAEFKHAIENAQLRLIKGGRFIHVLGKSDKGAALIELTKRLEKKHGAQRKLICLGDTHNDLDMLNIADIPVFVRSPVHDFPKHKCVNPPIFTRACGPVGWHEAITKILN